MAARFKNISGDDRDIPALHRRVAAGETFEVPDELAESFAAQAKPHPDALWEATTSEAREAVNETKAGA